MRIHSTNDTFRPRKAKVGDRKTIQGIEYVCQYERVEFGLSQGSLVRDHRGFPRLEWVRVSKGENL